MLVALSVAIHLLGLYGYGRGYAEWQQRHDRADEGRCLFELHDTQIEAHLRFVWYQVRTTNRAESAPLEPAAP